MPLRVGIVGAGLMGARRARTAVECGDKVTIVADLDARRAKACASAVGASATDDWTHVVARGDVDVVVVATPNKFIKPIATAAAFSGKHLLCEKPLGRNVDEAMEIVDAANRNSVTLKTGFNHRHHLAIRKAHDVVTNGDIGEPFCFRCVYGHGGRPGYDKEWRGDAELAGGGELLDQGVHVLDLARWFLGEFAAVSGVTPRWFWDVEPLEDNAFALLRTASGRVASLHTSWTQWKNRFSLEVLGRDGFVSVEGLGGSYGTERLQIARRRPESGPPEMQDEEFLGPDVSWQDEWNEFTSAIREGRPPLGDGVDGLEALRLVAAIYTSARDQRIVRVQPTVRKETYA
jgi:predicted dehydrogenase